MSSCFEKIKKVRISTKLAGIFGILSPIVVFLTFIISIWLHPWFKWEDHALSDLGAIGVKYNFTLNLGLILLGVSFFLFTTRASILVSSKEGLIGVRLMPVLALGPVLVALFPLGNNLHVPACFVPYSLIVIIMILIGIDYFKSKDNIRGTITFASLFLSIIFALLPLSYNIGYLQQLVIIKFPSQSIPELISAVLLSFWFIMFVSKISVVKDNKQGIGVTN